MSLHYEMSGEGPLLVLIHGWALNRHVWNSVVRHWSPNYRIMVVDLPGHGKSTFSDTQHFELLSTAQQIAQVIDEEAIVVGWSLGGLVALQLALSFPEKVNRLVTIATAAQFVKSADWPSAIETRVFSDFSAALVTDYRQTIQHFLAVQSLGSDKARQEIRALKEVLFIDGEPHPVALKDGLDILKNSRMQDSLSAIACPTLMIAGVKDTLVPLQACRATVARMVNAKVAEITGAGHAPFISHPDQFNTVLKKFIHD